MSGPTASRTARTRSTAVCSAFRSMLVRQGPGKGSNFMAENPIFTTFTACSAS